MRLWGDAESHFKKAQKLPEERRYEEAFRELLWGDAESLWEEALREYDQAISLNPKHPVYHYGKGFALAELGRYEEALREYDQAISLNPKHPDYHNGKGNALYNLGRYEEALREYDKAISLDPKDPDYHYNKGNALRKLGRHEEALREYDQAISLNPKNPVYHNGKGLALAGLGRHEEALKEYDQAISLNPKDPDYHYNKGNALYNLGRYEEALKEYEQAISLGFDRGRIVKQLGEMVGKRDGMGNTMLHLAVRNGMEEMVRLLLDAGADVNAVNNEGHTPLYYAILSCNQGIGKLLLDRGADPGLAGAGPELKGDCDWARQLIKDLIPFKVILDDSADGIKTCRVPRSLGMEGVAELVGERRTVVAVRPDNVEDEILVDRSTYLSLNSRRARVRPARLEDGVKVKFSPPLSLPPQAIKALRQELRNLRDRLPLARGDVIVIPVRLEGTPLDLPLRVEEAEPELLLYRRGYTEVEVAEKPYDPSVLPPEERDRVEEVRERMGGNPTLPQANPPGSDLSNYTILEKLGEGGFATVYRARDREGNEVAVKVYKASIKDFVKEVAVWEILNHPNIVKLLDYDVTPLPHVVMELMKGGTLSDKRFGRDEAVKIMIDVLEGLKYAHSKGIVHRDIKPSNILLDGYKRAKITDWGIARIMDKSTTSRDLSVTLLYASPEQLSRLMGDVSVTVDEKSDIYQVCEVFYEILTGRPPFEGDLSEVAMKKRTGDFPLPSSLDPSLGEFDPLFRKCLSPRKEERYTDDELLKILVRDRIRTLNTTLSKSSSKAYTPYLFFQLALYSAKLEEYDKSIEWLKRLNEKVNCEDVITMMQEKIRFNIHTKEEIIRSLDLLRERVESKL
ncbi:tetratricopeptide repeat protein [Metallosphaera javensis (ex Sakai et al. 2022)]|uniref:tetratricopeptide repeat protein n=1 Tax=Metallosphaera javensis (ex Sakai et al. 2022) TaxID=2775498 RepID=UPI002583A369|nr:MAG: serine/threonine-protein kinase PknD [Metallosphaera javensis (ex Sakai et al. 2022)]